MTMTKVRLIAGLWAVILISSLLPTIAAADPGTLLKSRSFESAALERPLRYSIYIPSTATSNPVPAVYLLHGLGGRETDWEKFAKISTTLNQMIAAREIPPIAVVMPDGANSWYINSAEHGDYETAIITDLVGHIEKHYPVSTKREGRYIAGLSMGGYGALRLAFHHPSVFSAAASLSGAMFPDVTSGEVFSKGQMRMFRNAYGDPFSPDLFNESNIFGQIPAMKKTGKPVRTFITVGDDDGFGLYRGSIALYLALKDARLPVEMRITDGDHNWKLWRDEIRRVLIYFTAPKAG